MTDMMVNIIVEMLDILGTATKEMKQSRASKFLLYLRSFETHMCSEKFLKKIAGITKLEDGLKKLDKMTNEEARMANAEMMRLTHGINKKVEGVDEKVMSVDEVVKSVDEKVLGVDEKVLGVEGNMKVVKDKVQTVLDGTRVWFVTKTIIDFELSSRQANSRCLTKSGIRRRRCKTFVISPAFASGRVSNMNTGTQLRVGLRQWQNPSDPSMNHNFASGRQYEGTAKWFCGGSKFDKWKVSGSLLWVHGKRTFSYS